MFKVQGPKGGVIIRKATPARLKAVLPGLRKRFGKVTVTPIGNPAPIKGPNIPVHVPPPVPAVRTKMVSWAHWGVENCTKFVYTEGPQRSEMFNRKPGDVSKPIHADCSQWYASICHWCGIPGVTDTDFTGTLLKKGKLVRVPKPGDCVIFGPGSGAHAAMITERGDGTDWWTIGFGHQGAPDRVLLSNMKSWFKANGNPGVRFLAFTP